MRRRRGRWAFVAALRSSFAAVLMVASVAGCPSQNESGAARPAIDEARLPIENAGEPGRYRGTELDRMTAQRDRLAAENADLKRQLASQRELERPRDGALAEAEAKARLETDAIRKELEQALANIRLSRQRWEDDIASRQRTIDMLTSEVERLRRELQSARDSEPASRPE
ncbi:MAG: hypothetical protein KA354_05315 [Phycisphaerae bacterium]|nr:hypothetical protein [Phycisphaerae bacterium]